MAIPELPLHWLGAARVVEGRRSAIVAIMYETRWAGLSLSTGRPAVAPTDVGVVPVRPIQYADLDGDGEPEILAQGTLQRTGQQSLVAFSWTAGRELWAHPIGAPYESMQEGGPPPDWPMVVDLDGDGRSEVLVPHSNPITQPDNSRGVLLLDGKTGRTRWYRPMRPPATSNDGLAHFVEAPDLDGDGTRDVVIVSRFNGRVPATWARARSADPPRVYVDALSGTNGHPLWFWNVDLDENKFARIWAPRWWGLGADGWPLLAVTLGGRHPQGFEMNATSSNLHPPMTHVLEAVDRPRGAPAPRADPHRFG